MLTVSAATTTQKNAQNTDSSWLVLLEIADDALSTNLRFVYGQEDVTWPATGGDVYTALGFTLEDMTETASGELPNFRITIPIPRDIQAAQDLLTAVDDTGGGYSAQVTLRIVNTDIMDEDPAYEDTFDVIDTVVTTTHISFGLGGFNPLLLRCPKNRYLKHHCRYKRFGGSECNYGGSETECDRTFARCIELGNAARFGGFPGINAGGLYGG